ncbi:MAG: agmatine deiminase family protein [Bacteroidota bacterium]
MNLPVSPVPAAGTPLKYGYRFPAEWEPHAATWLSWPHKEASWPDKIDEIFPVYAAFIKEVAAGEKVNINVNDAAMQAFAENHLRKAGADMANIAFHLNPSNDAWCRDHGPAFLVNPKAAQPKIIVDWGYNAWGDKYPPYDLDDEIPTQIATAYGIPVFLPGIVMEGGSVDFNGRGTLLTSRACLLNPNRNPTLSQSEIEGFLRNYYGVSNILWLNDGIVGDDTDGHIDDITRFVNHNTVVTVIEENEEDENYELLQENLELLKTFKLEDGSPLNIISLPMPKPVVWEDQRLPASYANFYIANAAVIVPTYGDETNDAKALEILTACFPDRKVIGLDSTDLIWGLGSFHCLSQQEPV